MEPLITPAESGRLDTASDDAPEMLMERAGLGVALMAVEMGIGYGDRVTVLAGRGLSPGAAVRRRILGTADLATLDRWLLKAGTVSSPEEVVED